MRRCFQFVAMVVGLALTLGPAAQALWAAERCGPDCCAGTRGMAMAAMPCVGMAGAQQAMCPMGAGDGMTAVCSMDDVCVLPGVASAVISNPERGIGQAATSSAGAVLPAAESPGCGAPPGVARVASRARYIVFGVFRV